MKTKFIKVPVYDKLPKKEGTYFIKDSYTGQLGSAFFSSNIGFRDTLSSVKADYWLEEVLDLEDDYRDMLEKCYQEFHKLAAKGMYPEGFLRENGGQGLSEISALLQKSKNK